METEGSGVAKELFDEEASSRVEAVAEGSLGDGQHLLGRFEVELAGEKADIVLILADAMGEHLEREQRLGPSREAAQAGEVEDRSGIGVRSFEKALDGVR